MKKKTQNIIRWILFIPASILASEIAKFLFNLISGGILGILELYFPILSQTIGGIVTWAITAMVLIFTAYKIIPSHKKITIKIYAIFWTIFIIGLTIFMYYMTELEIAGSFWYPLLINLGYFIGIWFSYFILIYEDKGNIGDST